MKISKTFITILLSFLSLHAVAETVELLPYGNFDNWVTRNIKESRLIGGKHKNCYAIGPTTTINGDEPYINAGGSPWSSSNVMAKVCGITKVSNAVFPDEHEGHGKCAKLTTTIDSCTALGIVNIKVVVAGTLFLGQMLEPVKSTSNPYAKMEMGMPFTKHPDALVYDYKLVVPATGVITYSSGFGKKRETPGVDKAEVFVLLQRRWEDEDGNIYAKRVGTGRELIGTATKGWENGHKLPVHYGDITHESYYKKNMGLIPEAKSYYARNSHGKMVPVKEVGWDDATATPTHIIVMFSSGSGEPYTGTLGMTMWVDNVGLAYNH